MKDILKWFIETITICFGTHRIEFKKSSNDSPSKTDFIKSLKINEIESDDEKDSDDDDDDESGSGSDSGGMAAKPVQGYASQKDIKLPKRLPPWWWQVRPD